MALGMSREELIEFAQEVFDADRAARQDHTKGRPASSTELLLAMGVLEHLSGEANQPAQKEPK